MSDEQREAAAIHITSYQHRLANSYNRRVKPRVFQSGDLVLRKVFENTVNSTAGKFQPKWEGPCDAPTRHRMSSEGHFFFFFLQTYNLYTCIFI